MPGTFDFCDTARVAQELPPEEMSAVSFNGWEFTSAPDTPYRRSFKVMLSGMRWYLNAGQNALDITTDPKFNAGKLLDFYKTNRKHGTFTMNHEYLGAIVCRFANPVVIPPAIPNSDGLIETFEVNLLHYNPGY